jgi:hypothetical protein
LRWCMQRCKQFSPPLFWYSLSIDGLDRHYS